MPRSPLCESSYHNRPTEPKATAGDEAQAYLTRLAEVTKRASGLDRENCEEALRKCRKLHVAFSNFDRALRALEQRVGAPGRDRKRAKIQALADRGATEGERQAAAETLARLNTSPPPRSVTDPEPLPRTLAELQARKRKH
jgi:hypothetical protein